MKFIDATPSDYALRPATLLDGTRRIAQQLNATVHYEIYQRHSTLRFVTNRFQQPRYTTQRNGSFVNLTARGVPAHQAAACRNASLYNATE